MAKKCEVQLSYIIGVANPVSINVETYGTSKLSEIELIQIIRKNFDLCPDGIINMLNLRRPIYRKTSAYGHFGRNDIDFPWENTDKIAELRKYLRHISTEGGSV